MADSALDQTTLEESFFFCEYAKRRFEMSCYNNGDIEKGIETIGCILNDHFQMRYNIPYAMQLDFFSDVMTLCELIVIDELNKQFNCGIFETRRFTFKNFKEQIIKAFNEIKNIKNILDIQSKFMIPASFLPFPYNIEEIILNFRSGIELPKAFPIVKLAERKCLVRDCNNYILFLINKNLTVKETIKELTKQATLFKSDGDYEHSSVQEILGDIHKELKSGKHRQSLNNVFYKSTGLLLYDIYISSNCNLDFVIDKYKKYDAKIKCDPSKKSTAENCNDCKQFSVCTNSWRKQFNSAVKKISGEQSSEDWLRHVKETSTAKQMLTRRSVKFFEYNFAL